MDRRQEAIPVGSFDDFLAELGDLGTSRAPETLSVVEVEAFAAAVAGLPDVTQDTLAGLIQRQPDWLPLLVSCIGMGLEQLRRQLRFRLGSAGWRNLARRDPTRIIVSLDTGYGLVDAVRSQSGQRWTFTDVLVERHRWSRRLATGSVQRGRRLEDRVEAVVRSLGLPFVMRSRFAGIKGQDAPCDFAIPGAGNLAQIVGAVKGFNSTGSKLSDAVREIEKIAQARLPRQFVFAFVDGIGWLGRQSDLKRIYDLWAERSIDGLYSLAHVDGFRSDLEAAARRLKLL